MIAKLKDFVARMLPPKIEARIEEFIEDELRRISCTRDLTRPYFLEPLLKTLYREYNAQAQEKDIRELTDDFWGQYITVLMSVDKKEVALNILKQFSQQQREPVMSHYINVAKLANVAGCASAFEKRVVTVFEKLSATHSSNLFASTVSGKTVAVVGNGPSEIGKGSGGAIDAHDIVIRINNYAIQGHEADYGSKTDIWLKACVDYLREQDVSDLAAVVYETNYERWPISSKYIESMEKEMDVGNVDYFDQDDHNFWTKKHYRYPTTGLVTVEKLRHLPIKSLDVYGFSFLQDTFKTNGIGDHYAKTDDAKWRIINPRWHDMLKEVQYFSHAFPNKSHRLQK